MSFIPAFEELPNFLDDISTLDKLKAILDPDILKQAFEHADVATVRRRRLPLESYYVVSFRTQDNEESPVEFGCDSNQFREINYPQVRMCSLMEVSSHLLLDSSFDARYVGEITLTLSP